MHGWVPHVCVLRCYLMTLLTLGLGEANGLLGIHFKVRGTHQDVNSDRGEH